MSGISGKFQLCICIAAILCAFSGCNSRRDRIREEIAGLRGESDRQIVDLTGKPAPPRNVVREPEPPPPDLAPAKGSAQVPQEVKEKRPRPEWVGTGFSRAHPIARYIVGAGSCRKVKGKDYESLIAAEDRARDTVARNICVRVQSEYDSAAKLVAELKSGKAKIEQDSTRIASRILSTVDLELEGVIIADRWFDKKENAYWVLAVYDRRIAGENIMDRIKRLRQEIAKDHELGRSFRQKKSPLTALGYYNRATGNGLAIMAYRAQLRIISPEHAARFGPIKDDPKMAALWRESALAAREVRVGVIMFAPTARGPEPSPRHADALTAALRHLDLTPAKLPMPPAGLDYDGLRKLDLTKQREWVTGRANCLVLASVETEHAGSSKIGQSTAHFHHGSGEAVVVDLVEGSAVADASFANAPDTYTGHWDRQQAAAGALEKAAALLSRRIKKQLAASLHAASSE